MQGFADKHKSTNNDGITSGVLLVVQKAIKHRLAHVLLCGIQLEEIKKGQKFVNGEENVEIMNVRHDFGKDGLQLWQEFFKQTVRSDMLDDVTKHGVDFAAPEIFARVSLWVLEENWAWGGRE